MHQTIDSPKIEIVQRPTLPVPRRLLDALKKRSEELGLTPGGGAVQAFEAWLEATKDQIIFPG